MTTVEAPPESTQQPQAPPEPQALVPQPPQSQSIDLQSTIDVAKTFVQSGFFSDTKKVSQAVVKIMAGREFGIGPFAAMRNLYISKDGKIGTEAHLMAQRIKASGKYNYRVRELTDDKCSIEFFEKSLDGTKWESVGSSDFDQEDAKRGGVGKDNAKGDGTLKKWPRNMLFARALSNGFRWHCPDAMNITGGAPNLYTPEEIGFERHESGEYIEAEVVGGNAPEPIDDTEEPQPMAATTPPTDGLRVENVIVAKKSAAKESPAWTLHLVKLSDGREAYTLNDAVAARAKELRESKAAIDIETEHNEAKNRDEIVILAELQPEQR
jgi:hypothetical protein